MPNKSQAQAHFMAAVAHGWKKPGGGGPSVKVAKEFNQADKGVKTSSLPAHIAEMKKHGLHK